MRVSTVLLLGMVLITSYKWGWELLRGERKEVKSREVHEKWLPPPIRCHNCLCCRPPLEEQTFLHASRQHTKLEKRRLDSTWRFGNKESCHTHTHTHTHTHANVILCSLARWLALLCLLTTTVTRRGGWVPIRRRRK